MLSHLHTVPRRRRNEVSLAREVKPVRVHITLQPGQKGMKKLYAQYDAQLVCVYSRDDAARHRRRRTVAWVVE